MACVSAEALGDTYFWKFWGIFKIHFRSASLCDVNGVVCLRLRKVNRQSKQALLEEGGFDILQKCLRTLCTVISNAKRYWKDKPYRYHWILKKLSENKLCYFLTTPCQPNLGMINHLVYFSFQKKRQYKGIRGIHKEIRRQERKEGKWQWSWG